MRVEMKYGCSHEEETRVLHDAGQTRFISGKAQADAAFWVELTLKASWQELYILLPACAYDGNRFTAVERRYPPMFLEEEFGLSVPTRMTQVPRLSPSGDSLMEVTTGDLAIPCVCVFHRTEKRALLLFLAQGDHGYNHGITIKQSEEALAIRLRAPAGRSLVYRWYDGIPSLRKNLQADPPRAVAAGEETVIEHRCYLEDCADIPALFGLLFQKRMLLFSGRPTATLPFSAFFALSEEQQNLTHYVEAHGYYALNAQDGRDDSRFGRWQAGWVGGGMGTYAFLVDGNARSRGRALSTLAYAARYQSAAGWFYGIVDNGKVYHDCFTRYEERYSAVLVRKHMDLTNFLWKQLHACDRLGISAPKEIRDSAVRATDAIITLWERYGQLGQFVNTEMGEILVGGSASGGAAPAALCAAAAVTGENRYLRAAEEIGAYFEKTAIAPGVCTGGPGEALQAPDSESTAALLESYMALYEATGKRKWLGLAEKAAWQLASWVVAYDYEFPKESRFERLGIAATGSVWANVQNKHAAPGLCTASPAALLKLFRATGNADYLELMRQIAHFSPQVVSTPERPMGTTGGTVLKPGEICERVNLSDWEGRQNVGDSIFGSSSWPEHAMLLTWLEIPGVYVLPERGIVCASDHVNAWLENGMLKIENPTAYDATVKVMVEHEEERSTPLGLYWQERFTRVAVRTGESVTLAY